MASDAPEIAVHKEWLGQIQPVGLVVSPYVLARYDVAIDRRLSVERQARLKELIADEETGRVDDFRAFTRNVLLWPEGLLAGSPGGPPLPDSLTIALPEHEDHLSPTFAIPDPEAIDAWLALVSIVAAGTDLDKAPPADHKHDGWRASPHARLERLLRETRVPVGLLFNGVSLRLVYAPHGESSGHLTFQFAHLAETLGRPMVGALVALLDVGRVTDLQDEPHRLPALLRRSRESQNEVSTKLAGQVMEALWDLVRGFQRANDDAKGDLLAEALRAEHEVYGGLLSTLMRLVFVLYAEDRGLMPKGDVYQKHYAVSGLFNRLREDQARYPDTMDARYGAWAQLLALFRLIHDGGGHGDLHFPARHGRLFDPDAYPFLEGRPFGSHRSMGELVNPPRVSDGVVFRVLQNLLMLDGERLSYRALDVEQIGSVYEAMMGFALQQAGAPSIAVSPKHIVVNLRDLLEQSPKDRTAWLQKEAELKLTGDALAKATTEAEALAALGKKVSRYTPHPLPAGAMFLQPTEERRRSGSHYTPRSLTAPIVSTTFRPVFERLGDQATPEQILDLKVCDPAMGSGAFLVEACRLLAERLVKAWETHKQTPKVPDEEDVITYARRLVAERCLYGVDKNIFAVDLAKLSLWLATLAREHPFTFLDHALRHGDSLVGLSREQIACFNWEMTKQMPLLRTLIDQRVAEAQLLRERIQSLATSDDVPEKARLLRDADDALHDVRHIGDLVVSAFFARDKPKERQTLRAAYAGQVERWLMDREPGAVVAAGSIPAIVTFHWEIEFPEVFTRPNGGFDAFVGNPPFMGGRRVSEQLGETYNDYLCQAHQGASGGADLVAHFYRSAFDLLRNYGTFGLIATNTIAQGDTRSTGLRWIRMHGGTIFAVRKRVKWPGEAAVIISVVHVQKGPMAGPFDLDTRSVDRITAFLFHAGNDEDPRRLTENANKSFQGSIVLGMGFTFDDADKKGVANRIALMHELIRKDPRNAERIFPYIGGEEVNESPTHAHHRYVINFGEMSEAEARRWPDLFALLEDKVKPERITKDAKKYPRMVNEWWKFWNSRTELQEAIRGVERVLVVSRVADALAFTFLPAGMVYSEQLVVIAASGPEMFAPLQSRVHEAWTRSLASSMKDDLRYTPSDCFETFPFPSGWAGNPALQGISREYFEFRAALMLRRNEGLTKAYNRFHDPDEQDAGILRLRELHSEMDRVVLEAYGWSDIYPTCQFILDFEEDTDRSPGTPNRKKKPWRYRWPDEIRDDVLGRLVALNDTRAKEEEAAVARVVRRTRRGVKGPGSTPLLE
jgi:Eco57I restriction-modification methylase/restriction-modification enzyme MmeI-like protein